MNDGRSPPAYDAVVDGTWQQNNTVQQTITPYPPYPAPSTNVGFENNSFHASQQISPSNLNTKLINEAPPSYNATVGGGDTKVDVTTSATPTTTDSDETSCESFIINIIFYNYSRYIRDCWCVKVSLHVVSHTPVKANYLPM